MVLPAPKPRKAARTAKAVANDDAVIMTPAEVASEVVHSMLGVALLPPPSKARVGVPATLKSPGPLVSPHVLAQAQKMVAVVGPADENASVCSLGRSCGSAEMPVFVYATSRNVFRF